MAGKSYFKKPTDKLLFFNSYDEELKKLDLVISSKYIDTCFGKTHILFTEKSNKPTLLLFHGLNSCAPQILKQFSFLNKYYQLITVDVLGQPNKSDEIRLSKKNDDYAIWVFDLISKLQLSTVSLLGYSFGAFICTKAALKYPNKINNLFLFSPAGFVNGNAITIFSKLFFPFLMFKTTKQQQYLKRGIQAIYTDIDNETIQYTEHILLNYKSDMSATLLFTQKELLALKPQTIIFTGEQDILFPANKIIKRFSESSSIKTIKFEDSKHVLGKKQLKEVAHYFETTPFN